MRELQERMDAVEFAEWKAYYRIYPFGDDWAQADMLAWMLYQANRGPNSENLKIGSFLPKGFGLGITEDRRRPKEPEDVGKKLMSYFKLHGVTDGR